MQESLHWQISTLGLLQDNDQKPSLMMPGEERTHLEKPTKITRPNICQSSWVFRKLARAPSIICFITGFVRLDWASLLTELNQSSSNLAGKAVGTPLGLAQIPPPANCISPSSQGLSLATRRHFRTGSHSLSMTTSSFIFPAVQFGWAADKRPRGSLLSNPCCGRSNSRRV